MPASRIPRMSGRISQNLRWIKAGHDFIEQQEAWLGGQCPCQFETLAGRHRKAVGRRIEEARQSHLTGNGFCAFKHGLAIIAVQVAADGNVVANRHSLERLDDLKRASNAAPCEQMCGHAGNVAAAENNTPARRRNKSRDDGEQGRLACAVGTDQRRDAAGRNLNRRAVDGEKPAGTVGKYLRGGVADQP